MTSLLSRTGLPAAILMLLAATPAWATQVRDLAATHRDGQTFLTWTSAGAPGTIYRVYQSVFPMLTEEDLASAALLGAVGDSTWCDRRLSSILGTTYGYAVDSLGPALAPTQGLCVVTPDADNVRYYAVTAQRAGRVEEREILPGANALSDPVTEVVAPPRPVFQRTLAFGPMRLEVYTLWASDTPTPSFPAMANRLGCAYDCGVVRGATHGSLMVRMHGRGWNFIALTGSGQPGEWLLTLDDYLPTAQVNSFWFGYHENYQLEPGALNPVPASGQVEDYTVRRALYTVEWARRNFPVDTTAVYAMGTSMGGIGAVMLAMRAPRMFAAAWALLPKFDFSFTSDPNPDNLFNAPSGPLLLEVERMWGTVDANLPTPEGIRTYESLNAGFLAGLREADGVPPIIAFNGKNDGVVGWAEKIPFYAAMQDRRLGGYFFFDQRGHAGGSAAWRPMEDPRYVYRFRTNGSFPALSRCSADHDPGNGLASSGDSVGAINGFVEWDPVLTDNMSIWLTNLRLRDLRTAWGVIPAPSSVTVDVTPRRLQEFEIRPGTLYVFVVRQLSSGSISKIALVTPDAKNVVTLPGVLVTRGGTEVRLLRMASRSKGLLENAGLAEVALPRLSVPRNPLRGSGTVTVTWPGRGEGWVDLLGVAGRLERRLWRGDASGAMEFPLDGAGLPAGVYFISARQGGLAASERVVILP